MGKKLYSAGAGHASTLVSEGKIKDSESWSAPSTSEENSFIEKHGLSEFGKWHLGYDPDEKEDNKGRFSFPFSSDFEKADLSGLLACLNRAAQSGYSDIENKARALYEAAKKKLGKDSENSKGNHKPWLVVNHVLNQGSEDVYEMVIAGTIGSSWYDASGATAKEFREKLGSIPAGRKVHVRINSEGGSIGDALEMYNLLQARKEDTTCFVDGYAFSSASIVALGGGRTIAPHSSILMIHEPWSMTVGNEADHLKAAEMLDKHGDTIAAIYSKKTGKSMDDCRQMMKAESWFTGAEACAYGLADAMAEGAKCPDCGHEQCDECETDSEGNITCSECVETNPAEEWEEEEEQEGDETMIDDRMRGSFAALNINQYRHIPNHIYNMLRPAAKPQPPLSVPRDGIPTNKNEMKTTAILALLNQHGIKLADNAGEDEILAALGKLGEKPANGNTPPDELSALREQLQNEKRVRVTAEVKRRGENRITNDCMDWWIGLAMKDEAGTYAQIDKLEAKLPGGQPASLEYGDVTENFLDEVKKIKGADKASERFAMLRNNWDGIMADALARDARTGAATNYQVIGPDGRPSGMRLTPVNTNTYSATLITAFLLDGWVTKLQNRWAPLKAFTREFSTDRYKPLATAQLKFVTVGSTNIKNPTTFGATNSGNTVAPVSITVDQYHQPFAVTNAELNSGLRMENLVDINVAYMADAIMAVALSPLNTTDYASPAKIIRAPTAFTWSDMGTAWGELKKSPEHYALLDGEYFGRIMNQPGYFQQTGIAPGATGWNTFGWDGIYLQTSWTGTHALAGDQNIRGLFCNRQAIGVASGLPLNPPNVPGNTLMESTITIPGVDVTVAAYTWFELSTRSLCVSYDLMFGSQKLDTTAAVLMTDQ